jgi:hypothetical protein
MTCEAQYVNYADEDCGGEEGVRGILVVASEKGSFMGGSFALS